MNDRCTCGSQEFWRYRLYVERIGVILDENGDYMPVEIAEDDVEELVWVGKRATCANCGREVQEGQ